MQDTAFDKARALGLSMTEVSMLTGANRQTLYNWFKNKPFLFDIVLLGCAAKRDQLQEAGSASARAD